MASTPAEQCGWPLELQFGSSQRDHPNSKELDEVTVISIPIAEKVVRHQSQRIGSGLYMASSPIFQNDLYDATHIKVDLWDMTNRWGGHETSTPAW